MTRTLCGLLFALAACCEGGVSPNLLRNPSFEEGLSAKGVPVGWEVYGALDKDRRIELTMTAHDGRHAVLIRDGDATREIGLEQTVPAEAGLTYEASVMRRAVKGASSLGAYLQLRFFPGDRYVQTDLATSSSDKFVPASVKATAPPGTQSARVYLYTHGEPTPTLIVDSARLVSGVEPPPPPPPPPVPPVYTKLKDLYLTTRLVVDGKPNATIVVPRSGGYTDLAARIARAVAELSGVPLPVAHDEAPEAAVPIRGHLIVLGNRSTNQALRKLYDLYYTLLDLKYPGPGGYVVRTLHNPFGDGRNVILVGGSDLEGVAAGTSVLVQRLNAARGPRGQLAVGRLADIRLGEGLEAPKDIREARIWEASAGYRDIGYFGWNSLSKRMALYYMTGDPFHARKFIRLAFPDEKAMQEIAEIDGERIEIKGTPLSGPYHYNAHMMILFWDLIEESPVFTDEERLRVTNAFSRQLDHRKGEGIYRLRGPSRAVGSRHGQWSAISLYCLGRYFQKDYPSPLWQQCMDGATHHFGSLHRYAWVGGESDNLFWYNTGTAPILTWLVLTGDRKPIENGVLATLLRGQEILASGVEHDWALRSASVGFLHKAAYLTQDGRWLEYRRRTGVDADAFRLGQSFWPEERLKPKPPSDLVGKWSIHELSEPMWQARHNGFPLEHSFQFASTRSAPDASGDFVLIDGFNGASRNPYHTFAILELRLGGQTILKGYRNQLLTRADGLVEPKVAMNAALRYRDVIGPTAICVAEVPDAAYCNWRRTLIHRTGRYALVIDDLAFRTDSENIEAQFLWETATRPRPLSSAPGAVELDGQKRRFSISLCDPARTTVRGRVATMEWRGSVRKGQHRVFFSTLALASADPKVPSCARLAGNAALLGLPTPALAVVGRYGRAAGDMMVIAEDHLFARGLRNATLATLLVAARTPVDLDWDFAAGRMHIHAGLPSQVSVPLEWWKGARLDGGAVGEIRISEGSVGSVAVGAGRHVIEGLRPSQGALGKVREQLAELEGAAAERRSRAPRDTSQAKLPELAAVVNGKVDGSVVDLITIADGQTPRIAAAAGKQVHLLGPKGTSVKTLQADGPIRVIRWWPEHSLLLAGCADEKVIAFDRAGERKWVFTSKMDPAVFRAAKTYWFKSARGHAGIHGLTTGAFLEGKSQCFVGSACTLEILDEHGKLIRRMPQFWGKVSCFAFLDGPDGSIHLLAARKYNGTNRVAIINNRTLDPRPRGFHTVPPGHTYVGGWSSMNRHHLFVEDLDGDGTKEVCSEINGTWNRVTVWTAAGKPLYDASFGPGDRIPARNLRDMDVADLDGDGKKEIVVATRSGLVVALDCRCRKLWARRLASPPTVLKCFPPAAGVPARIVAGCEDGRVVMLDGQGKPSGQGSVQGRPTCIGALRQGAAPQIVLLATAKGEIAGLRLATDREPR